MKPPRYAILRQPVLMEDEGRTHLIAIVDSRAEIELVLDEATRDGYFTRSDFVVMEEPRRRV